MKCSELEITRVWTVEGRLYISASHEPSFFNLIRGIDWTHVDSRKITNKQKNANTNWSADVIGFSHGRFVRKTCADCEVITLSFYCHYVYFDNFVHYYCYPVYVIIFYIFVFMPRKSQSLLNSRICTYIYTTTNQ